MHKAAPTPLLLALLASSCSDGRAPAPAAAKAASSPAAANENGQAARAEPRLDCSLGGRQPDGGYPLHAPCPGRAPSPDGAFAVAIGGGDEEGVALVDARGRRLDDIVFLNDAMPFTVYWAPNSRWFFVNHYLGSDLERLRVFEVVNRVAIERSVLFAEATRMMVRHSPCLARDGKVVASGRRWSRDGRSIALVAYARTDACFVETRSGEWRPAGHWQALWMIGDAKTGRIDPASVRVQKDGGPMPKEGPYARL